jgi:hypothetical protein
MQGRPSTLRNLLDFLLSPFLQYGWWTFYQSRSSSSPMKCQRICSESKAFVFARLDALDHEFVERFLRIRIMLTVVSFWRFWTYGGKKNSFVSQQQLTKKYLIVSLQYCSKFNLHFFYSLKKIHFFHAAVQCTLPLCVVVVQPIACLCQCLQAPFAQGRG